MLKTKGGFKMKVADTSVDITAEVPIEEVSEGTIADATVEVPVETIVGVTVDESVKRLILKKYWDYALYLILAIVISFVGGCLGSFVPVNEFFSVSLLLLILIPLFVKNALWKRITFYIGCLGTGFSIAGVTSILFEDDALVMFQIMGMTLLITLIGVVFGLVLNINSSLKRYVYQLFVFLAIVSILRLFIPMWYPIAFMVLFFGMFVMFNIEEYRDLLKDSDGEVEDARVMDYVIEQYLNIAGIFLHILEFISI